MKSIFIAVVLALVMVGASQPSRADVLTFAATLNWNGEAPPTSNGTGLAIVTWDTAATTMRVQVTFAGLNGITTASHIHSATPTPFTGNAGVATQTPSFNGFPLGVSSGTYDNTFNMSLASSYNPSFITANGGTAASAAAALLAGIQQGRAYLNIHSTTNAGGEIRGFLVATPEPATMLLLGTGLAGVALKIRRRLKAN